MLKTLELLEPFVTKSFLPYVHHLKRIFNPKVGFRWNFLLLYFVFSRTQSVVAADKLHMTPAMHVKGGFIELI